MAYHVKDEDTNRQRDANREKAIDWYLDELCKGPIIGGTLSTIPGDLDNYGSFAWEALEKAIRVRDPMCRICGARPTREVHHIRPKHLKGRDHPRNLIGLCLECHDEVHRKIEMGIQKVLEDSLAIEPPEPPKPTSTLDTFMGGE